MRPSTSYTTRLWVAGLCIGFVKYLGSWHSMSCKFYMWRRINIMISEILWHAAIFVAPLAIMLAHQTWQLRKMDRAQG